MLKAPYSSDVDGPWQPNLAGLHLWRVQPSQESLHQIIRPSTAQKPIVMTATCMSGRKVVLGIWAVSEGEAIFMTVYDPKAIVTLEVTILCGWWAELELPPVKSMTTTDLDGLAAYVTQGISLQLPPLDHKGRVDMTKAYLKFDPGPAPPLFEFGPNQFDARPPGCSKDPTASSVKGRHVVWKGLRRFGRRAILLACARNGPSEMVVRGWDSSMAWRMTNVVTFYEEDWRTWNDQARPSSSSTGSFSPDDQWNNDLRRAPGAYQDNLVTDPAYRVRGGGAGTPRNPRISHWRHSIPTNDTTQASKDRLCQDIADRVEMTRSGKGGKTSLMTPRAGGECGSEEGRTKGSREEEEVARASGVPTSRGRSQGSTGLVRSLGGGHGGENVLDTEKDAPAQRIFLSYKHMEQRMGELDRTELTTPDDALVGVAEGLGPKRPPEAKDWMMALTGANSVRAFIRRRGAEKKTKSVNEIVEQLRKEAKRQDEIAAARRLVVVQQWKDVGKVLCRLLRMSDYWYGFTSDLTLSSVERSARRISVLQQMVEMRAGGGGSTQMKSLVRAFAERYPRAVWSRFRQLMRQPKAQRCRRDMTVCAMLLSDTDNPFFRYTTAEWPISRLVDLTTDARLVEKLPHAVLYEEGETAARIIGKDPLGAALVSNTPNNGVGGKRRTWATFHQGQGKTGACGGVQAKAGSRGRIGLGNRLGRRLDREGTGGEAEEPWAAGAYVIMRGSVCLHVLERGAAANQPTVASQENLAAKACRGQPMFLPRPPPEWEAAGKAVAVATAAKDGAKCGAGDDGLFERQRRRQAIAEHLEASLLGSGAGPRRPRTRNVAPKWRACRLGPGSLFGDRPVKTGRLANPNMSGSSNGDSGGGSGTGGDTPRNGTGLPSAKPAEKTMNQPSALETAVTTEPTELLEIGLGAYRRFLADGVKKRIDHAVAVLRATGVMDGVPTPALERICRYATDHTACSSFATSTARTLLANPGAPASARGTNSKQPSVICRKGAVRGKVFFIAEGHGEVLVGGQHSDSSGLSTERFFSNAVGGRRRRRRGYRSPTRGSAAGAGANGHPPGLSPEKERGRYQDRAKNIGYPMVTQTAPAQTASDLEAAPETTRSACPREARMGTEVLPTSRTSLSITSEASVERVWQGENDEWWEGTRQGGIMSMAVAAVLKRGDFFGLTPAPPTTSQDIVQSATQLSGQAHEIIDQAEHFPTGTTKQPLLVTDVVEAAATAAVAEAPEATTVESNVARSSVTATPDPSVVRGDTSTSPVSAFEGLHTASLVAGPGGVKCLAVGLSVLQKVCPPVHGRLKKAVTERYSGWIEEAGRRVENEWHDLLENESVKSLSSSFYETFKGHCSNGHQRTGYADMAKSVGWASTNGGGSLSSIFAGGECRGGVEGGDGAGRLGNGLGHARADSDNGGENIKIDARPATRSPPSTAATGLFDLGRRFKALRSCSSVQTVIPVRLGRAVPCESTGSPIYEPTAIGKDQSCPQTPRWRAFMDRGTNNGASGVVCSPQSPRRGLRTRHIVSAGRSGGGRGGDGGMFSRSARWRGTRDRSHDANETLRRGKEAMEQFCEKAWEREGGIGPHAEQQRELWDCPVSPFSPPLLLGEKPTPGLGYSEEGGTAVFQANVATNGSGGVQTAREACVVLGELTSEGPEQCSPRSVLDMSSRGEVRPVEEIMHVVPTAPGRRKGSGWRLKRSRISGREKRGRGNSSLESLERIAKGESLGAMPQGVFPKSAR